MITSDVCDTPTKAPFKPRASNLAGRRILASAVLALSVASAHADVDIEEARSIARLYSAAFDREPKPEGLNFWIDSLEQGQSLRDIAERFRRSDEFSKRYGDLSPEDFVRQLYRNILGRDTLSWNHDHQPFHHIP